MPASRPSSDPSGRLPTQPEVARPRASVLAPIEEEGISWEGQVLVVGHDGDIAARLFVTTERIILTGREGAILLETPRSWLVPAPLVVADNGVRLSVTPAGEVPGKETTERLHFRIVDGRGPAVQLVAILTGRARLDQMADGEWNARVGAGRANMLPALPAFETRQDAPREQHPRAGDPDPETRGVAPISDWRPRHPVTPVAPESFRAPEPEPVEATSRAARFLTSRSTAGDQPEDGEAVVSIEEQRRKRGAGWLVWTSRVAVLALVVLAASWFGRQYIPEPVTDQLPASVTGYLALNDDDPEMDDTVAEVGDGTDGTDGAENDPAHIMPTEAALGLGGGSTSVPDGEGGQIMAPLGEIPTPTPPADDAGAPAGEVDNTADSGDQSNEIDNSGEGDQSNEIDNSDGGEPTTAPVETQDPEPTTPAGQSIVTETPEPTAPAGQTVVAETPEPTEPAGQTIVAETPEPTSEPSETDVPATQAPDGTPGEEGAPSATATPDTAPTEPALEPQKPSVNPDDPPEQAFADQGFRYSVDGAATGTSIEELPEVAEVSYGEWIVLAVSGTNWTDADQVFDMSRFTLLADGQPIQLDVGNSWVASLLSYTPAYGNTDAILWAPGEEHQFVLTFLAPKDAESLVLQAGDQRFDLGAVLTGAPSLTNATQDAAPETIDATVVDALDGETIVIEKDGVEQTVRYLGIDAPTGDDCFADEATEANRALVEGKSVKIERQATNVDAQGNWVRDVWVENDDGTYVLVAHQLVKEGAAEADISQPNTRFTGWLRGAEAMAKAESLGLWGSCGAADAGDGLGSASTVPVVLFRHTGALA